MESVARSPNPTNFCFNAIFSGELDNVPMSFLNQVPYRTLRHILELKGLGHEMNNFLKV